MTGLKKTQIKREKADQKKTVWQKSAALNPGNLAKEVYTYGYHFLEKRIYLSLVYVLPGWE